MTIGEALKEERENLGLSRYKFSKGVVDRKFYGKVEENNGVLSSEKLIQLLQKNNIDFAQFFEKVKSNENLDAEKLDRAMRAAFEKRDINECKQVCQSIMKLKGERILKLRTIVAIAYLDKNLDALDENIRKEIVEEIYKSNNITQNVSIIRLFANTMPILSEDQLNVLVSEFLRKAKKSKPKSEIEGRRIAVLLNNYLAACWERKINTNLVDDSMEYLMQMKDVHLLIYKEVGKFYFELIKGNRNKAKKIKHNLADWGYQKLADTL